MNQKAGRTDTCACGSGRKYKHCCLRAPGAGVDLSETYYRRASELAALGRLDEAVGGYRAALSLRTDYVEAHVDLGNALQRLGEAQAALSSYRRALELRPGFAAVHLNIGAALQALGRFEEAIASYREAQRCLGPDARLLNNLAIVQRECGRLAEAEASFRAALSVDNTMAVIHNGLAGVLLAQGRLAEAQDAYRNALAIEPGDADAVHGLADVLVDQGRWSEAMFHLRRALDMNPGSAKAWSGLLMKLLYSDAVTVQAERDDHRRFAERFEAGFRDRVPPHANAPDPARRIKIGYVSADLRSHSVAYFIEPILCRHDRTGFEITCYYGADNEDDVTRRFRALADHWVAAARLSDEQLAARIRADRIDILVDLSGHSAGNRLLVFARKPAPVQLSWVGYPAPSGLRHIDHFLTDSLASPHAGGADAVSAEANSADPAGRARLPSLYRLPRVFTCYRPPAFAPPVQALTVREGGGVVLGSFNNAAKISPTVVRLWSRLLQARTKLSLLVKDRRLADPTFRAAFLARFAEHGVGGDRIELVQRSTSDIEHLAQYERLDIALDTYPYCGVTTTCESLWMGVPVVSLAGARFASRMGLTLLSAIGHPEWVAFSEDEYIDRVLALADAAELRAALRVELRSQMQASPLMDEDGITRDVEGAYRAMWQGWCARVMAGAPPEPVR